MLLVKVFLLLLVLLRWRLDGRRGRLDLFPIFDAAAGDYVAAVVVVVVVVLLLMWLWLLFNIADIVLIIIALALDFDGLNVFDTLVGRVRGVSGR